jgi:hypothetical protein
MIGTVVKLDSQLVLVASVESNRGLVVITISYTSPDSGVKTVEIFPGGNANHSALNYVTGQDTPFVLTFQDADAARIQSYTPTDPIPASGGEEIMLCLANLFGFDQGSLFKLQVTYNQQPVKLAFRSAGSGAYCVTFTAGAVDPKLQWHL